MRRFLPHTQLVSVFCSEGAPHGTHAAKSKWLKPIFAGPFDKRWAKKDK
jgi:hypothetical protein